MARPLLVLIHHRIDLPWIFEAAERVGCDVVLVPRTDEDPADVPAPVVDVLRLDVLRAPDEAMAALRAYHRRRPLAGLLTMYDPAVPFTAAAAAELGRPGLSPAAAQRATDKRQVRDAIAAAGGDTPRFVTIGCDDVVDGRVADLRFPVVVKPAGGYSSLGVVRVEHPELLADRVRQVADLVRRALPEDVAARGLLVEEYIEGPEYAAESFVWNGRTYVHSVGYKGQPVGPYFEEGVYQAPAELPADVYERIVAQVTLASAAIGIDQGPVHTELRVSDDGRAYVFDVGARIGGSGVSHFVTAQSTGIDFAGNALRVAVGQPPVGLTDRPTLRAHAGNYIVRTGGTGIIAEIIGLAGLVHEPAVRAVVQFMGAGDEVRPYPDFSGYPAFVLSVHDTADELRSFHHRLDRTVHVCYR